MAEILSGTKDLIEGVEAMKDKWRQTKKAGKNQNEEEWELEGELLKCMKVIVRKLKQLEKGRIEDQKAVQQNDMKYSLNIQQMEEKFHTEQKEILRKLESVMEERHIRQEEQIGSLQEKVRQKEEQLQALREQVRQKEEQIQKQQEQLGKKEQQLQRQQSEGIQKEKQLQEQQQQYRQMEEQMQALYENWKQREEQLQEQQVCLMQKEQQIWQQNQQLQEKEEQIRKIALENAGFVAKLQALENQVNEILDEKQLELEEHEELLICKEEEYNVMERKLKKELRKEQEQNGQLMEELETYQREIGDWEYYWELRGKLQREPLVSDVLTINTYEKYIVCCSNEETIVCLYYYFKTHIYQMSERQRQFLSELFDHCLLLHNQLYPSLLLRQTVHDGDTYDYEEHQTEESSSNSGKISQVLLPGVVDEEGTIFRLCKAYVTLGE